MTRLHAIRLKPAFCCNFPERDFRPAASISADCALLVKEGKTVSYACASHFYSNNHVIH